MPLDGFVFRRDDENGRTLRLWINDAGRQQLEWVREHGNHERPNEGFYVGAGLLGWYFGILEKDQELGLVKDDELVKIQTFDFSEHVESDDDTKGPPDATWDEISIDCDDEVLARLEWIKLRAGRRHRETVLIDGVRFYRWILEQKIEGYEIGVVQNNGLVAITSI